MSACYRVKTVADMLDVSPEIICQAIASGDLEAVKIGPGKGVLRVPESALRTYLYICQERSYEEHVVNGASIAEAAADESGAVAGEGVSA